MELDWTEIGTGIAAAATTVWAAYQNWDNQPGYMKFLLIAGPLFMLGVVLAVVG